MSVVYRLLKGKRKLLNKLKNNLKKGFTYTYKRETMILLKDINKKTKGGI